MSFCISQTVPDDDAPLSPQAEAIWEILDKSGAAPLVIESVMEQVASLEALAMRKCLTCARAAAKAEDEVWAAVDTTATEPVYAACPHGHGFNLHLCNECLAQGDFAYNAARDRAAFGR